ncbi:hypothetical protein [Streptomyces sp. NPDC003077]|uniref:hypothetical protein n=1 Tax=Streptomyces sp. NPDC003077 TaxID=3154443 RepID=UPI0033B6A2B7
MRLHHLGVGAVFTTLVLGTLAAPASASATPSRALPACPKIFGHGGYPSGANARQRDQIRQPNNTRALSQMKAWGAAGVEGDLQLTRDAAEGVMWHNPTTYGLSGRERSVTAVRWSTGADRLHGRTITRGPYRGETVHTFRDWLDQLKARKLVGLVELKGETRKFLLSRNASVREAGWRQVIVPIKRRIASQEILIYTHDKALKPVLDERLRAAGLSATRTRHPVWVDTVAWREPPPSAAGNHGRWSSTLAQNPQRVATSWTKDYAQWLRGKCR